MSTQIHVPAKDKTPQIGYYRAGRQQARGTRGGGAGPGTLPRPAGCQAPFCLVAARGYSSLLTWGRGRRGEGRRLGLRCDSATPGRQPARDSLPQPSPAAGPPRPSPRSDSAGPGPLCVTASLVSASDWTAVFTSLSDKVGNVWVPVSVSVRTCISAHLVSFSALSDAFLSLRLSTQSVCLPGSCLGLLSGTASASLA